MDSRQHPKNQAISVSSLYETLRELAAARLRRLPGEKSLAATDLVHEAFLKLQSGEPPEYDGSGHLLAQMAQAMRWVAVDRARRRAAMKRGGGAQRVAESVSQITLETGQREVDLKGE